MNRMNAFARQSWIAIRLLIVGAVLLGIVYPLLVTGVGKVIAADAASGSLVTGSDGTVVGSSLIGQNFGDDRWFQSRPSAAGADGYDAQSSSGSNLGPNNEDLLSAVEERRTTIQQKDGTTGQIPPDALTASGSGLDPHISPEYAALQVSRVAKANKLSEAAVAELVAQNTQGRQFGFLGEERVNVLLLNLAIANANRGG